MTVLATPTPYLRDGLRRLVAGLRKDAETVRLNLAQAEQDVAAARALLAEAEAQHKRAKDAADALTREIAFFEEQAERTPPAYDPDAALAATGLMPCDETERAGVLPYEELLGREVVITTDRLRVGGRLHATSPDGLTICVRVGDGHAEPELIPLTSVRNVKPADPDDDLTAPGVADSRAQVAPHLPVAPPVPHGPDAGTLAALEAGHPITTRTDHAPSPRGQHAAPPRTSRVTGALRKVGLIHDEQDGDQADG